MIGKVILNYKILEELGRGGMGVVYKAHDAKLDRFVALKFLPEHISTSELDKERFLQEAKAASAINHPNVCTIYDIKEFEGREFIVMEYVEGETLGEIIQDNLPKAINLRKVIEYAIQIGEALQAAHDKDVIHRDVKSENIMITTTNQVKVMDFGLAKLKGSLKLTKTGSTVGTLAYMAPEQLQGEETDARSDIFSFGVVLFEMLTGELPFQGEYESALMYSILNENPKSVQKFRPDIPVEYSNVVNRVLEKEPELRYQSAKDFVAEIKRLKRDTDKVSRKIADDLKKHHRDVLTDESRGKEIISASPTESKKKKRIAILGVISLLLVAVISYFTIYFTSKEIPVNENTVAIMYIENQTGDETYTQQANILIPWIYEKLGQKDVIIPSVEVRDQISNFERSVAIDKKTAAKVLNNARIKYRITGIISKSGEDLHYILETSKHGKHHNVWQESLAKTDSIPIEVFAEAVAHWIETCVWIDKFEQSMHEDWKFPKNLTTRDIFKNKHSTNVHATKAYYQGFDLYQEMEWGKSLPYFSEALKIDPEYIIAATYLSSAYYENNQREKGLELLDKWKEKSEKFSDYERLFFQSQYEWYNKALNRAVLNYQEFMKKYEPYPDLWFADIGTLFGQLNDYKNAVKYLEKHIQSGINPRYDVAYIHLWYYYIVLGEWKKAQKTLLLGMKINPQSKELMFRIIIHYLSHGKTKDADKWFEKYEEISKLKMTGVAPIYIIYGNHYLIMDDFPTADDYYQSALGERYITVDETIAIANQYQQMRKFGVAEKILQDAIKQNPKNAAIYEALALLFIERIDHDYTKALDFSERAYNLDVSREDVLFLSRALYFEESNRQDSANVEWTHLINKYEESFVTHEPYRSDPWKLGIYFAFKDDVELAIEQLEIAYEKGYRDYFAYFYHGGLAHYLAHYPAFDKIREDPRTKNRYEKLIEKVKASYPALNKKKGIGN